MAFLCTSARRWPFLTFTPQVQCRPSETTSLTSARSCFIQHSTDHYPISSCILVSLLPSLECGPREHKTLAHLYHWPTQSGQQRQQQRIASQRCTHPSMHYVRDRPWDFSKHLLKGSAVLSFLSRGRQRDAEKEDCSGYFQH